MIQIRKSPGLIKLHKVILGGLIKGAGEGLYLGEYNSALSTYNFRLKILMFVKKPKSNTLLHKMGLYQGGEGGGGRGVAYIPKNIFVSK